VSTGHREGYMSLPEGWLGKDCKLVDRLLPKAGLVAEHSLVLHLPAFVALVALGVVPEVSVAVFVAAAAVVAVCIAAAGIAVIADARAEFHSIEALAHLEYSLLTLWEFFLGIDLVAMFWTF